MKLRGLIIAAAAAAAVVASLGLATSASATTCCIPGYFQACPDNGSNVGNVFGATPGDQLDLAMSFSPFNSDGEPDTVMVAPGTYADPDTSFDTAFQARGSDDLTVIGSGRDQTFLTSAYYDNNFVVDLNTGSTRDVTMKNLAVVVPEQFPDGLGAAIQTQGDTWESVDVITENHGSDAFASVINGGTFKDVRILGTENADFGTAFRSAMVGTQDPVTIEDMEIKGAAQGIAWSLPGGPVDIDGLRTKVGYIAINASDGVKIDADNVLIESGNDVSVQAYNNNGSASTMVTLNHATIIAQGDPTKSPVKALVNNNVGATGIAKISLFNSVVYGFTKSWELQAPTSGPLGDAILDASYTNFGPVGTSIGDAQVNNLNEVVGVPDFADSNDFHPVPGSILIDSGDPGTSMLPEFDLDDNPRLVDGDGDGNAIRDLGAYEYQGDCNTNPALCPPPTCETDQSLCPPPTCETDQSLCPPPTCETDPTLCPPPADKTAPKITKVKFRFVYPRGGALAFRLSEAARVRAVIKPTPAGKGKAKRRTVRITRNAKAGPVRIKLAKRRLKPGRYLITIAATDAAGNRSKPVRKRVRVRAAR